MIIADAICSEVLRRLAVPSWESNRSDQIRKPLASFLSQVSIVQGRPQDALRGIGQVQERLRDWGLQLNAVAYYALGRRKESDAALAELIAKYQAIDEDLIARVYAFRDQPDEAFKWLDRAYARHNDGLILTKIDPLLNNLHGDPRYADLLKKLNLPN